MIFAALTKHTGLRLAEIGFLLMVFSGVWFAVADNLHSSFSRTRGIVAGGALAVAGLLLIIATHYGHFG